jgi:hypothetical protein
MMNEPVVAADAIRPGGWGRKAAFGVMGATLLGAALFAIDGREMRADPFEVRTLDREAVDRRVEASIVTPMIILTEARVDAMLDHVGGSVSDWTQARIEDLRVKSDGRRRDAEGKVMFSPAEIRGTYDEARMEARRFGWGEARILQEIDWAFDVEAKATDFVIETSTAFLQSIDDFAFAEELAVFTVTSAIVWDPMVHGDAELRGWTDSFDAWVERIRSAAREGAAQEDPILEAVSIAVDAGVGEALATSRDAAIDAILALRGLVASTREPEENPTP